MQPLYVSKNLIAASSNGIGSVSTASTSVVTVNSSYLDTGRRIVFYSTADASSMRFTVFGYNETVNTTLMSESVLGSTASGVAATTTADFYKVTAISLSSNANIPFIVGTSSVGGTTWKVVDWHGYTPVVGATLTFSTSANGMTGSIELSMDDPTGTYQNPNYTVPNVLRSTSHVVGCSTNSYGISNVDANSLFPVAAWRMTLTSTSSGAGTLYGTVMVSGVS